MILAILVPSSEGRIVFLLSPRFRLVCAWSPIVAALLVGSGFFCASFIMVTTQSFFVGAAKF